MKLVLMNRYKNATPVELLSAMLRKSRTYVSGFTNKTLALKTQRPIQHSGQVTVVNFDFYITFIPIHIPSNRTVTSRSHVIIYTKNLRLIFLLYYTYDLYTSRYCVDIIINRLMCNTFPLPYYTTFSVRYVERHVPPRQKYVTFYLFFSLFLSFSFPKFSSPPVSL